MDGWMDGWMDVYTTTIFLHTTYGKDNTMYADNHGLNHHGLVRTMETFANLMKVPIIYH